MKATPMHQVCDEREAPEDPPDDQEPVCGLCKWASKVNFLQVDCNVAVPMWVDACEFVKMYSDSDAANCPCYELDREKLESMMEVEP